ncbi:MAG: CinA family nicotinamide mononucleotide deamidase-related protein [Egibacteraceae bacterium]
MRAELVAVGSELLLGEAVDTNSAWISARLAEVGVDVSRHTAIGDDVERMLAVLRGACERADVVIVTGGLGPTHDDLTRVVVSRLAGVGLHRHGDLAEGIAASFAERGLAMPANNLAQADLPVGARVLAPVGTAPGFAVEVDSATVYCVPGVPREMEVIIARDVVTDLVRRGCLATTVSRVISTTGMSESEVAERCAPVVGELDAVRNPTVALLASWGETRVRVTAKAASREAALALADPVVDRLVGLLGVGVAGLDGEGVEAAIGRQLRRLGLTLGVAESVTGGRVAARIVSVPGASGWFRGGLVTYATSVKATLGGVDPAVLERDGPVAESTVGQLAVGACDRLSADVGLAVVGVAGPAVQGGREIGTCCLGVALPGGAVRTRTGRLPCRTRADVQEFAASAALDYLRRRLAALGETGACGGGTPIRGGHQRG